MNAAIFFLISLAAQLLGFYAGNLLPEESSDYARIFVPSLVALTIVYITKLPRSWRVINALFPVFLYAVLFSEVPSWIFLAVLLFFATLHLPALWTRVPYYPTPASTYDLVLEELPLEKHFTFVDIGCGVGSLLSYLAKHRPNGTFIGVELSVFPYLLSKFKSISYPNMTVSFKSFWNLPMSRFDYIYAFLSPAPMEQLWKKISSEKRADSMFISNSFEAPTQASRIKGSEGKGTRLFIYS